MLILSQFVESNGEVMSQKTTGLCNKMHKKVQRLVLQSQRSKLMPRPLNFESYGPWDELNTYYEFPVRYRDQPMRLIKQEYWK